MAVVLNDKTGDATSIHYCQKELPGDLRYEYWGIGDKYRVNIKQGTVARCSCNRLWQIRTNGIGIRYWSPAGPINRIRYRNHGKEIDA